MNWYQLAKIFELSGILIGTGLGTILFNPDVLGKFSQQLSNKFTVFTNTITNRYIKILSPFMDEDIPKQISKRPRPSIVAVLLLFCLLLGINFDIYLLTIIGAIGVGLYSLLTIVDTSRKMHRSSKGWPMFMYPLLLIYKLVIVFAISSLTLLLPNLLFVLVSIIVLSLNAVARKKILRQTLVITGFILIITGLSIEIAIS